MLPTTFARLLCAALLLLGGPLWAQFVRQPNSTLNLPPDLPKVYDTVNALGTLTFSAPMCTAFPPGETKRLYVLERGTGANGGVIRRVTNLNAPAGPAHAPDFFMNLSAYLTAQGTPLATDGENGMLSMVFHPNYNTNGYFYVYFSLTINGQLHQRLARFKATDIDPLANPPTDNYLEAISADPATMAPLLTILDQQNNHNGGDLNFGADGYLYVSLGDEGGGGDLYNNARFINKDFWGQMLRIDVDSKPTNLLPNSHSQPASTSHPSAVHAGSYRVPADNPFIGRTTWHGQTFASTTVRTEIFATGFRNPFRFSIDPPTGRIFLGDVGQGNSVSYEEIDLVVAGGDYGWSWREGFHAFYQSSTVPPRFPDNSAGNTNAPPSPSQFIPIDPIFEYDRSNDGSGNDAIVYGVSVCGGLVYHGDSLPELEGAYLFAEIYGSTSIVALRETSPGVWSAEKLASRSQIVDFGTDPRNGEPLLCSLLGTIYRLQRNTGASGQPPSTLSATGAFSDLSTLTPHTGIVPYDPNVAFWSDYALKSRWFSIKNTTDTIAFNADGNWTFPTGMVWMKHFDFELVRGNPATRRRLETRFLVKTENDVYGLSYQWNNIASGSQTNATLVGEAGLTQAIPGSSPSQLWRYPSRGECRTCHTAAGGFALSFNTRQMNRTREYGLQTLNQISAFGGAGYFTTPPGDVHTLPAFARADDTSQSLEWRVRSYLAVNCAQCHQPAGGVPGNWDARAATPTDLAGLIDGLLVNNGDDPAARWCVPGDAPAFGQATHSMVLKRIRGDGAQRMPPLATNERDLSAEALLTAWITQDLPSRQNFAQWQAAQAFATPEYAVPGADPDGDGQDNTTEFLRRTNPKAPDAPPLTTVVTTGGNVEVSFSFPGNRSCIIESSVDLLDWSPWSVPGNSASVPAVDGARTIVAPIDGVRRFFRARLTAP